MWLQSHHPDLYIFKTTSPSDSVTGFSDDPFDYSLLCCRFKTPDIDIVIGDGSSSKVAVGNSTEVTATFTNLLPVPLTKVQWYVEGSGLTEPLKIAGRYGHKGA